MPNITGTKKCSSCKTTKPITEFYLNRTRKDGRTEYCQSCIKAMRKTPKAKATIKAWNQAHPEQARAIQKRYHQRHPDARRWVMLRHNYGVTELEFNQILVKQGGKCAICGKTEPCPGKNRNFDVDHDHVTGKVRGLLCMVCNHLLGNAKDDINILSRAIEYLRQHKCRT